MKLRRSERMVVISNYLISNSYKLTNLNTFAEKYEATKSSVSEDITITKKAFEESGIGEIETVTGVNGGVTFISGIFNEEARAAIEELHDRLSENDRILPGGYIYLSDLLSTPRVLQNVGRIIASASKGNKINAVMAVATKGVLLANAVTDILNVPFIIVRRDLRITEGSTVSISYVSGSGDRIEKVFLSKRSLKPNSRISIVDDLPKGGGTISSTASLLKGFGNALVGIIVFAGDTQRGRDRMTYEPLLKVSEIDIKNNHIKVEVGNTFN